MAEEKRKKRRIIDNKRFYKELVEYNERKKIDPTTPVTNSLAEFFLKLCNHLGTSYKFHRYPYLQDMIGDGVMECIKRIDNFNPDKYDNPHAYFSTIVFNSFIRKIKQEKKDLANRISYIGHKMVEYNLESEIVGTPEITEEMNQFLREYEEADAKRKLEAEERRKEKEASEM